MHRFVALTRRYQEEYPELQAFDQWLHWQHLREYREPQVCLPQYRL